MQHHLTGLLCSEGEEISSVFTVPERWEKLFANATPTLHKLQFMDMPWTSPYLGHRTLDHSTGQAGRNLGGVQPNLTAGWAMGAEWAAQGFIQENLKKSAELDTTQLLQVDCCSCGAETMDMRPKSSPQALPSSPAASQTPMLVLWLMTWGLTLQIVTKTISSLAAAAR